MSTRTIIEISHDCLRPRDQAELVDLFEALGSSTVTELLNKAEEGGFQWSRAIRVLGQRHHSEPLKLVIGNDAESASRWPGLRPMGPEEPKP